jgi:hypothetical protein
MGCVSGKEGRNGMVAENNEIKVAVGSRLLGRYQTQENVYSIKVISPTKDEPKALAA